MRLTVFMSVAASMTATTVLAFAQTDAPSPAGTGLPYTLPPAAPSTPPSTPPPSAPATSTSTPVAATPAPTSAAAPQVDGDTDHARVVGHVGVGYLGQFNVPDLTVGGETTSGVPVQIVGARYWLSPALALSGGVGVYAGTGSSKTTNSVTNTSVTTDAPGLFAMAFKAGVPLALFGSGKHFTFILEPQAVFGFASRNSKDNATPAVETSYSATRLAVGATAGAEVQFGFMGIPELGLTATVGMALDVKNGSRKITQSNTTNEVSASELTFTTLNFNAPWNIFTGNVSAIYYF